MHSPVDERLVARFQSLYQGLPEAFGTGRGEWIKRPPKREDFRAHLAGVGPGLGIAPLRRDGTVMFAAIDLDEPDFAAALAMQDFIPGPSFIERSRSGNAHILVYFAAPIEAWVARGILKEVILAAGKAHVEVFPKADRLMPGMLGSYINLGCYGDDRPVMMTGQVDDHADSHGLSAYSLEGFVAAAEETKNLPDAWRKRARWLQISSPEERLRERSEFGTQQTLHCCAEHIIASRDENPVVDGHRAIVYFNLAKMLCNYEGFDLDEAFAMMQLVNDSSPDAIPDSELRKILSNAERGRFTSTGCDDPVMAPYVHPDCPIAHPRS